MAFDPDEYLKKNAPKGFDPDAYLNNILTQPEQPSAPEEYSIPETALHHGAQGLTLGFSDELIGGARALANAPSSDKGLIDLYEQYRDLERKKLEESEQQNKATALASDLLGGVVTGGGIAKLGAKGVAKYLPALGEKIKDAGLLGKGLAIGADAAVSGAVESVGRSDAEDIKNLAKQGAGGAVLGGILGTTAGTVIPGIGKIVKESPYGRELKNVYERSKKGQAIFGEEALAKSQQEIEDIGQDIGKAFNESSDTIGKTFDAIYKKSPDVVLPGESLRNNLQDVLQTVSQYKTVVSDPNYLQLSDIINNIPDNLPINEVQNYKKLLGEFVKQKDNAIVNTISPKVMQTFNNFIDNYLSIVKKDGTSLGGLASDDTLGNLLKQAKDQYKTIKNIEDSAYNKILESSKELKGQGQDILDAKLKSYLDSAKSSNKQTSELERLLEYMDDLNPEKAAQIRSTLPDAADYYRLTRKLESQSPRSLVGAALTAGERGAQVMGAVKRKLPTAPSIPIGIPKARMGNLIGKVAGAEKAQQIPENDTALLSRDVADRSSEELRTDAQRLLSNPNTASLGKALNDALDNNDQGRISALVNKMLQIREARQILNKK